MKKTSSDFFRHATKEQDYAVLIFILSLMPEKIQKEFPEEHEIIKKINHRRQK